MKQAIYPGSFDPPTNGHMDIIERARQTFDHIIVAIADNIQKKHAFTIKERMKLVEACTKGMKNVEVDTFQGLLVDFAHKRKVKTIVRGLRAVSDFEYEFQLANMNRKLAHDVETTFLMTGEASFYVSSRLVREVAQYGAELKDIVPDPVRKALLKKFPR